MSADTLSPDVPARFGSGRAVARLEDESLLKGVGRYTDDVVPAGQLRAVFVRSPHPHARIVSVDADSARGMEGVQLVLTGADLQQAGVKTLPLAMGFKRADGQPVEKSSAPRPALAFDRVRFVGEPVAIVVAQTLQQARDAAEAIWVEYEELPAAIDVDQALGGTNGAPLCDAAPDNIAAETRYGDSAKVDAAFARAAHSVALDIVNQRIVALALEPRTVLAWVADDGRLTLQMSSQMPSGVKTTLCDVLRLKPAQVRVTVGDVGGGFGAKTGAYPEDVAVAWCAWQLKRPVKWAADRSEEFVACGHGRDSRTRAQLALDEDGRILALRVHSHANIGAYATGTACAINLMIGPWVQTSVYDIPAVDFHFRAVMTNAMTIGAYRGAGRPEAIFIIERLMDEAARASGIDRIQLRRRNFVRPEQMPYRNAMGQTYDVGRFEQVMDKGLAQADWDGFEARRAQSAKAGKWRGLGVATFLEWTGGNALTERVTVTVLPDGVIEVFSAVNQMGQGILTTLAQLVVDAFDVPIDKVRVVLGDTDRGDGFGSAGSRSLFTGGSALKQGADRTLDEARKLAAQHLEASADDLEYAGGRFRVRGTDLQVDLFALAATQPERRIHVEHTTTVSGPSWPNGCHVCEVDVDPATGEVEVVRYSSVNDVGRVVNPTIVRGQLDGGAVQGLGQALLEQMVYDAGSGQPITGSLMDYAAPRTDVVACEFVTTMDESTPCTNNPLGVKGVGELGTIGATPCAVNAVADALARAGRAELAPLLQMPLTPLRLWELIAQPRA